MTEQGKVMDRVFTYVVESYRETGVAFGAAIADATGWKSHGTFHGEHKDAVSLALQLRDSNNRNEGGHRPIVRVRRREEKVLFDEKGRPFKVPNTEWISQRLRYRPRKTAR